MRTSNGRRAPGGRGISARSALRVGTSVLLAASLAGILAACGTAKISGTSPEPEIPRPTSNSAPVEPEKAAEVDAPVVPDAPPALSVSQQSAVRAAESYLSFMAFSRQGLIEQLSSEYGDQFAVEDATFAVDSLNVDWNAQAAKSAQNYLDMMGFSCQGLIDQLSSEYGDRYTVEQATFGAQQVGLC